MKTQLLLVLIVSCLILSCKQNTQTGQTTQEEERLAGGRKIHKTVLKKKWCDDPNAQRGMERHKINIYQARNYIWNYYKTCYPLARDQGAYTQINRDQIFEPLKMMAKHCGLKGYFFEKENKFYIAWQMTDNQDSGDVVFPIELDTMFRISGCHNKFSVNLKDTTQMLNHLISYSNTCLSKGDSAQTAEVNAGASDFQTTFDDYVLEATEDPVLFFHWNEINQVLEQNDSAGTKTDSSCTALRLYWGLDILANRLKVVVFGVDSQGKNIMRPDALMLERSWPPYDTIPVK